MFSKSMLRMIVQCLNCCNAGARLVEKQRVEKCGKIHMKININSAQKEKGQNNKIPHAI